MSPKDACASCTRFDTFSISPSLIAHSNCSLTANGCNPGSESGLNNNSKRHRLSLLKNDYSSRYAVIYVASHINNIGPFPAITDSKSH